MSIESERSPQTTTFWDRKCALWRAGLGPDPGPPPSRGLSAPANDREFSVWEHGRRQGHEEASRAHARELLEEERHRLTHEYGQGAYRDGAIRDRIARIDQLLACVVQERSDANQSTMSPAAADDHAVIPPSA